MTQVSNDLYEALTADLEGLALDSLWSSAKSASHLDCREHVEIFLSCLKRLLSERRMMLGKGGVLLDGSIEEQVARFERAFPRSGTGEADALDISDLTAGVWFFSDECPAGAVWVMRTDAGEEWLEWT